MIILCMRFIISQRKVEMSQVLRYILFKHIQDGLFRGCSRRGRGAKRPSLRKICHAYPTMMKLSTAIPYLKRIQKWYESRDTSPEFCWHQHFFARNQPMLLYLLCSADISIFLPEISQCCYIKKYRYRFHLDA